MKITMEESIELCKINTFSVSQSDKLEPNKHLRIKMLYSKSDSGLENCFEELNQITNRL